jgi:hypothetical protein
MSDLAAAFANRKMGTVDGREVWSSGMEIPGAGGGLRDAMRLDPVELHLGDTVFVVMECKVNKLRFDPMKDSDGLRRVHIMEVVAATPIDGDLVAGPLDEFKERVRLAKEAEAGVQRMPFDDDEPSEMYRDGDDEDAAEPTSIAGRRKRARK